MEDKNISQPADYAAPEQIVQPEPKNNKKTPIILATLLVLILIGSSIVYFLSAPKKSDLQGNPPISQAPIITTLVSPTSTANAPTKVVTVPLNAVEFVKDVVVEDSCNNPIGLVTYRDTNNDTWMRINSLLDSQNSYSEKALLQIEAYLKGDTKLQTDQDLKDWEYPFHNYCGGTTFIFMKELTGVLFPNTDSVKAMMVNTTQEAQAHATVVILAKKDNDIIQLSKSMDDPLYDACSGYADSGNENCFNAKLMQDKNFENEAINQANALISEFAIK